MDKHLTPFQVCERLIGPAPTLAPVCGVIRTAPYLWMRPSKGRAAGDIPSAIHQRALLDHSDRHHLGLTAEHLIRGAPEAEIAAILAARSPAGTTAGPAAPPDGRTRQDGGWPIPSPGGVAA